MAKDGLPVEAQYNQAIHTVLEEVGYQRFAPELSEKGKGKPDLVVNIDEETFVMEGTKSGINDHLERFKRLEMYKEAKHKGLYIISKDGEKMLKTVSRTEGGDVQNHRLGPQHRPHRIHRSREEQGHRKRQHLQGGLRPCGKEVGAQKRWQA